jgi:hypothetical protein
MSFLKIQNTNTKTENATNKSIPAIKFNNGNMPNMNNKNNNKNNNVNPYKLASAPSMNNNASISVVVPRMNLQP